MKDCFPLSVTRSKLWNGPRKSCEPISIDTIYTIVHCFVIVYMVPCFRNFIPTSIFANCSHFVQFQDVLTDRKYAQCTHFIHFLNLGYIENGGKVMHYGQGEPAPLKCKQPSQTLLIVLEQTQGPQMTAHSFRMEKSFQQCTYHESTFGSSQCLVQWQTFLLLLPLLK